MIPGRVADQMPAAVGLCSATAAKNSLRFPFSRFDIVMPEKGDWEAGYICQVDGAASAAPDNITI